jgi:predicted Fe-S protein YdhL (DUF1289 family)
MTIDEIARWHPANSHPRNAVIRTTQQPTADSLELCGEGTFKAAPKRSEDSDEDRSRVLRSHRAKNLGFAVPD